MELEIGAEIDRVEADVIEVRKLRNLPETMWSGTNGSYSVRLIASEVVRRKGQVNGFDHGGVTGITQLAELTAVVELLTTKSFTVATPEWKMLVEQSISPSVAKPLNASSIRAGGGEPTFRAAFRNSLSNTAGKPRVIYVGHPYRGLRQFAISAIPDSIYWDFQEKLVAQILALPVDLLCKPHPEGFSAARPFLSKTLLQPVINGLRSTSTMPTYFCSMHRHQRRSWKPCARVAKLCLLTVATIHFLTGSSRMLWSVASSCGPAAMTPVA